MSAVQPAGTCCSEETLLLMKRETGEDQSRAGGDRPELLGAGEGCGDRQAGDRLLSRASCSRTRGDGLN